MPWICPILSHQKVDLSSHFHVVDPPAGFIAFPLSLAARFLIVSSSFNVFNEPIHAEDSVQGSVCTFHVPFVYHHSPGNELQVLGHNFGFRSSLFRTYRRAEKRQGKHRDPRKRGKPRVARLRHRGRVAGGTAGAGARRRSSDRSRDKESAGRGGGGRRADPALPRPSEASRPRRESFTRHPQNAPDPRRSRPEAETTESPAPRAKPGA